MPQKSDTLESALESALSCLDQMKMLYRRTKVSEFPSGTLPSKRYQSELDRQKYIGQFNAVRKDFNGIRSAMYRECEIVKVEGDQKKDLATELDLQIRTLNGLFEQTFGDDLPEYY